MTQVVITGMGLCTPLGEGVDVNWKNLINPSAAQVSTCQKKGGYLEAVSLAETAASEALSEAGLWEGKQIIDVDPARFGCTVSASKPLWRSDAVVPPEVVNDFLRQRFGIHGESRNVIAACATGAYSIALAASWIEEDLCDAVLAGSVEAYPHPLVEAGFRQMGVISAESIMRPFDRRRSGFVFGAGTGIVVLESEGHFRNRGHCKITSNPPLQKGGVRGDLLCAVLSGWGLGSDPHSAVAFNSKGRHIADVIRRSCQRAGIDPHDIRHVNAHGTATRHNDTIETQAIQEAFGAHANHLRVSATKSHTGHLLGAAGSVELIFTVLALQHQFIPPTLHWGESDPSCSLDYTPNQGHTESFDHALSLSFGFGGPIGALIVSSPS